MAELTEVIVTAKAPKALKRYGNFVYNGTSWYGPDGKLPKGNRISSKNGNIFLFNSDGSVTKIGNYISGEGITKSDKKYIDTYGINNYTGNRVITKEKEVKNKKSEQQLLNLPRKLNWFLLAKVNTVLTLKDINSAKEYLKDPNYINNKSIEDLKGIEHGLLTLHRSELLNQTADTLGEGFLKTVYDGLAAYGLSAAPLLQYTLGAYGAYDATNSMVKNGVNLGNSIQLGASLLPYFKLAKISTPKIFLPEGIKRDVKALNILQNVRNVPATKLQKLNIAFRHLTPKVANAAANTALDYGASLAGLRASEHVNLAMDKYTGDWYGKDVIKSGVNALGASLGLGARSGLNLRNVLTGTATFGPGSYAVETGLHVIDPREDKDISKYERWGRNTIRFMVPYLLHGKLNQGISKIKSKLGKATYEDQIALRQNFKDRTVEGLVLFGKSAPALWTLNKIVPEDMENREAFINQLGYGAANSFHIRNMVANAGNSSLGTLSVSLNFPRILEGMILSPYTKYIYSGRYNLFDAMRNTRDGSIFGMEGKVRNQTTKPRKGEKNYELKFNNWLNSKLIASGFIGNSNYGELKSSDPTWMDFSTGKTVPKVGDSFGKNAVIIKVDPNNILGNDYASILSNLLAPKNSLIEIRALGSKFGDANVPEGVKLVSTHGVNRGDTNFANSKGETLNVAGSRIAVYGDNGTIVGVLALDFFLGGTRRITPTDSKLGKAISKTTNSGSDNYYNKTSDRAVNNLARNSKGKVNPYILDLFNNVKYLGDRGLTWASSLATKANVVNTTGYKPLDKIKPEEINFFAKLMLDPNGLLTNYKGMVNRTSNGNFKDFINKINTYSGETLPEKFLTFIQTPEGRAALRTPAKVADGKIITKPRFGKKSDWKKNPLEYLRMEIGKGDKSIYKYIKAEDYDFYEQKLNLKYRPKTIKGKSNKKLISRSNKEYRNLVKDYRLQNRLASLKVKNGKYVSTKLIESLDPLQRKVYEALGVLNSKYYK